MAAACRLTFVAGFASADVGWVICIEVVLAPEGKATGLLSLLVSAEIDDRDSGEDLRMADGSAYGAAIRVADGVADGVADRVADGVADRTVRAAERAAGGAAVRAAGGVDSEQSKQQSS